MMQQSLWRRLEWHSRRHDIGQRRRVELRVLVEEGRIQLENGEAVIHDTQQAEYEARVVRRHEESCWSRCWKLEARVFGVEVVCRGDIGVVHGLDQVPDTNVTGAGVRDGANKHREVGLDAVAM